MIAMITVPPKKAMFDDGSREVGLRVGDLSTNSDSGDDVSHHVSVDPVDDACIDISHLEQRWNLWVSGTTINPEHISHAPGTIGVSDDHRHSF